MGKVPGDVKSKNIKPIIFNDKVVDSIIVDLKHINYGLDKDKRYNKKKRSQFTIDDIVTLVDRLDGLTLENSGNDEDYDFYAVDLYFKNQKMRLVFCIENTNKNTICVITAYKR